MKHVGLSQEVEEIERFTPGARWLVLGWAICALAGAAKSLLPYRGILRSSRLRRSLR
jgi:hypothetical protein